MWEYAVHDLAVTPHLRLALDDENAAVVTAAAHALAAVVCPGPLEACVAEMADSCPTTGAWDDTGTDTDPCGLHQEQGVHFGPCTGSMGGFIVDWCPGPTRYRNCELLRGRICLEHLMHATWELI